MAIFDFLYPWFGSSNDFKNLTPPVRRPYVSSIFMPIVELGNSSTLAEKNVLEVRQNLDFGNFSGKKRFLWHHQKMLQFFSRLKSESVFPCGQVQLSQVWYSSKNCFQFRVSQRIYAILLYHGTITRTGITCKKISWDMHDSACRWLIVQDVKIFRNYVKHFWIFPRERNCKILVGLCK